MSIFITIFMIITWFIAAFVIGQLLVLLIGSIISGLINLSGRIIDKSNKGKK